MTKEEVKARSKAAKAEALHHAEGIDSHDHAARHSKSAKGLAKGHKSKGRKSAKSGYHYHDVS